MIWFLETVQMLNRGLFGSPTRTDSLVCSCGSARGPRSLCSPLGALGSGAFRRTAVGAHRARSVRFGPIFLTWAGRDVQVLVLLAAQLPCDRDGAQRPLLVRLAEGVGAELTEGLRVLAADVAVVPGTVPASCGGDKRPFGLSSEAEPRGRCCPTNYQSWRQGRRRFSPKGLLVRFRQDR